MASYPLEHHESDVCKSLRALAPRKDGGYDWNLPMATNCFRVLKLAMESIYGTDSTAFPTVGQLGKFIDDLDRLRRNPQKEGLLLDERKKRFHLLLSDKLHISTYIGESKVTNEAVFAHYYSKGGSHVQYWMDCDEGSRRHCTELAIQSSDVDFSQCEPSEWAEFVAKEAMYDLGSRAMRYNHIAAVLNAHHTLSLAEHISPNWLINRSDPQVYQYFDFLHTVKKVHCANDMLAEQIRRKCVEDNDDSLRCLVLDKTE